MSGPLRRYLEADHARIDALLDAAVRDEGRFDHASFEEARARLLRHIGIEEKILLPDARRRRGGVPLEIAPTLRTQHGAIASLLVPTPDHALVGEIRALLAAHNPLEEGEAGLYAACEELAGDEAAALVARAEAAPVVPTAAHFDGRGTCRTAEEALRLASRARQKA